MPVLAIWMPPFLAPPTGPVLALGLTDQRCDQMAHSGAPASSPSPAWIAWKWSM